MKEKSSSREELQGNRHQYSVSVNGDVIKRQY